MKAEESWSKRVLVLIVALYPESFRERFGREIFQTFSDMFDDCAREGRSLLILTIFTIYDGFVGLGQQWFEEINMTKIMPKRATLLALLLFLPFIGVVAVTLFQNSLFSDYVNSLLTIDGQQLNGSGRVVIFGSVLLVPVAFILNLISMWPVRNADGTLSLRLNVAGLTLGMIMLVTIGWIAFWMFGEFMSCSRGICD